MNFKKYKVLPPDPYQFRHQWQRKVAKLFDQMGKILFFRNSNPIQWKNLKKIAILRLDQVGDVVLAAPALQIIKETYPSIDIDFWVGPWSGDMAELLGIANRNVIFKASWLKFPGRKHWPWRNIFALGTELKKRKYDAIIDLRGDVRHLLAMWFSRTPIRIGASLTGGNFFLTHPVEFNPEIHVVEHGIYLLSQVGFPTNKAHIYPTITIDSSLAAQADETCNKLGISKNYIAFQPALNASSRQWSVQNWIKVIDGLQADVDIVLIGSRDEMKYLEMIEKGCTKKTFMAAGLFNLKTLAAFLKKSKLLVGLNSGPGHIAAAVGTSVISLFASAQMPHRWKPYGKDVKIIHKETDCWPCERRVCPLKGEMENHCMKQITSEEVITAITEVLSRPHG